MTIAYRVYTNHGSGGPVDYSAPTATTPGLTYAAGPVAAPSDTTFAVRAYDTATGFEEANTEARVRVSVGPDGGDLVGLPNPPHAVTLAAAPGGAARVSWAYAPAAGSAPPSGFRVYLTTGAATEGSPPAGTAAYVPGRVGYSLALPGPFAAAVYTAAVRPFNAAGAGPGAGTAAAALGPPGAPFDMDPVQGSVS